MRKIHIVGLAFAAVLAVCAFNVAAAFATSPEWLVDGAAVPSTAKVHVETSGTLVLADLKAGVTLECAGTGLGTVWEKAGSTEEAVATSCKTIAGSCGSPSALAHNLSWNNALELSGTEVLSTIKSGGKGAPGWDVTCFGFIEDTCTTEAGATLMENMSAESPADVLAIFNQGSIASCTLGGASSGEVSGQVLIAALEGLSLAIS